LSTLLPCQRSLPHSRRPPVGSQFSLPLSSSRRPPVGGHLLFLGPPVDNQDFRRLPDRWPSGGHPAAVHPSLMSPFDSAACYQVIQKCFVWLVFRDRINSRNLLKRKHYKVDDDDDYNCVLCSLATEEFTYHHVFFTVLNLNHYLGNMWSLIGSRPLQFQIMVSPSVLNLFNWHESFFFTGPSYLNAVNSLSQFTC
jgi:hypothetical protein